MDYNDKVIDHFMNPRNVGEMKDADGVGTVGNARCGDIMRMYLKIENDVVTDAKFKTFGCGAAVATSSATTELIKGKTIKEVMQLTNKDVTEYIGGLPGSKLHCSVLAAESLHSALWDYSEKHGVHIEGLKKPSPH